MIRRPPRSTQSRSSAASDVYKRQGLDRTWDPDRPAAADRGERVLPGGDASDSLPAGAGTRSPYAPHLVAGPRSGCRDDRRLGLRAFFAPAELSLPQVATACDGAPAAEAL